MTPAQFKRYGDLAELPVLRKSDLVQGPIENGPLGGYGALKTHEFAHIFQSPGPIYEPGRCWSRLVAHRSVFECGWHWRR
jgi:phenylacetate-CoA ligase